MKIVTVTLGFTLALLSGLDLAAAQEGRRPVDRPEPPARERMGQPEAPRHLGGRHAGGRWEGRHGGGPGGRFGFGERRRLRQHAREFVRSLEITPEQRDQARDVVRSLRPLAEEVRPQAHAILEQARELARSGKREEARELLRTQMKPLLQGALERAKPAVRPLVQTLTPEQRARLEAAAAARGREFDEERFTSWLTRRLARRAARP